MRRGGVAKMSFHLSERLGKPYEPVEENLSHALIVRIQFKQRS